MSSKNEPNKSESTDLGRAKPATKVTTWRGNAKAAQIRAAKLQIIPPKGEAELISEIEMKKMLNGEINSSNLLVTSNNITWAQWSAENG